ncbi:protein kinase [Synechocystis salina LEGE 00031]|uniref:Protein kinase n=1 Tax=Synechocystis salina LEGE 00031 TaxID=1828736 RepID=A0ABR9VR90_9SYNC|nr:serine/threonine-protein kinase [Synechocystis salina]MBE9253870.1 protein kinase [Synechocystis salina LEGE 00031]
MNFTSDLVGEIVGGKYDIQAPLGKGGSGVVYLAKKLRTNERYAIKTLATDEDNAIKLLERETETLKRLNHPNIVKFVEEGYEKRNKIVYLVLEYLDGQDIKEYFDRDIDLKTKLNIFLQIISGISHAHSKNIIHRDIKPDNIKIVDIGEQPEAKVLDFGIAIITTTILTNTIRSYHTPLFSAPEQKNLEGISRDSDVYSLGMTFLYLLSTQEARIDFQDKQDKGILFQSTEESFSDLDNSSILIDILKQAIDKEREKRPRLDQIRKVLSDFQEQLTESITVVFNITRNLEQEINDKYNYQNNILKIKRHIESLFKRNANTVCIKKSPDKFQKRDDSMTVEVALEESSTFYRGFINLDNCNNTQITILYETSTIPVNLQEQIFENGLLIKVNPIIEVGSGIKRKTDLSELIKQIIQKEQQIQNEIENNKALTATFEQWQSVINLEKKIINERKKSFRYKEKSYDESRQILILTLEDEISIETLDEITSPPLPVTISVEKKSYNRRQGFQEGIGNIIDGDKSKNGESVKTLHVSIGDFCKPEIIDIVLEKGKIETNFTAQESEIKKRGKALREIRYGDSENAEICKVIVAPTNIKPIEPVLIHRYFNQQLDESQQKAVAKALATEDIFLIQGPPGTGKTSVITEIILQILERYPNDKILISSQSNVAVDNVLTKISRIDDQEIKCIRIGREEKIEEEARRFEVEKAIIKWQAKIRSRSLDYWQEYKDKNDQVLSGIKKISRLEKIKNNNQELEFLVAKLNKVIARFNSSFIIDKENTASIEFSDIILESIYEKLELEQKILNSIEKYTSQFGIEYPEQKELQDWIEEEYEVLKEILGDNQENYEKFIKLDNLNKEWNDKLIRKQQDLISLFIDEINVVGATCLGVARFKDRNFDWVIIDEAGRSTAPETFVPMSKGKKIILVGDHRQLPPIIEQELQERALNEQELQKKILETSLFEYLYEQLPQNNKITLNNQYRMHPDIGNLVSTIFYENTVASELADIKEKQHNLTVFEKSVYWISTSDVSEDQSQERQNGKSRSNPYEAKVIREILSKIQEDCESKNLRKEVGVISAYRSQISVLESSVAPNDKQFWKNLDIIIHTVDAFQGGECDIIIYDLVRSNKKNQLGFTSDDRRLNVALSRAKQLLIIVGNDNMAYQGRTPNNISNPFKPLIEYIDESHKSCIRLESSEFIKF